MEGSLLLLPNISFTKQLGVRPVLSAGAVNQPLSTHAQPKDRAEKIVLFGVVLVALPGPSSMCFSACLR
jgi:hypothetical protein